MTQRSNYLRLWPHSQNKEKMLLNNSSKSCPSVIHYFSVWQPVSLKAIIRLCDGTSERGVSDPHSSQMYCISDDNIFWHVCVSLVSWPCCLQNGNTSKAAISWIKKNNPLWIWVFSWRPCRNEVLFTNIVVKTLMCQIPSSPSDLPPAYWSLCSLCPPPQCCLLHWRLRGLYLLNWPVTLP